MCYDKIEVSGTDTAQPLNTTRRINLIDKLVGIRNKTILDCGCGAGEYMIKLMEYENVIVKGIEYEQLKVDMYKKKYPLNNNIFRGDIENMPFENEEFDIIILNEVLEHVPNQDKGLIEIYRILKQEGSLIIISPNRYYPFETHGVYLILNKRKIPVYIPFIPYIPLDVGKLFLTYPARNYFPLELRNILFRNKFKIKHHTYICQTFEGIGGVTFLKPVRRILRKIFYLIEKTPIIRIPFSVSQVIIATK